MIKVGLTGGIASGKSTSADIILRGGFKVIDSDKIVKEILREQEVINYIKDEFGHQFILDNKILNKKFGDYIFTYKSERHKYEEFIMPEIFKEIDKQFLFYKLNNERVCILDAPILIEKNLHMCMDYTVLIWTTREIQLNRMIKRDFVDKEGALKRINSQIDINEKIKYSDLVIDNSKEKEFLEKQLFNLCLFLSTL